MKKSLDGFANIAVIVIAACTVFFGYRSIAARPSQPPARSARTAPPDSVVVANWRELMRTGHVKGSEGAPVSIIEFGDYQCPFCARVEPALRTFISAHTDMIRFSYHHWPLDNHRLAYPAARAAECAGRQGAFWEIHELLYQKQDSLGLLTFDELAIRAGVKDAKAFRDCNKRNDAITEIDSAVQLAKSLGLRGTPAFVINGVYRRKSLDTTYIRSLFPQSK
jgi:protein-disulfide isomerase